MKHKDMREIKFRQWDDGAGVRRPGWYYWGYIDGNWRGPLTGNAYPSTGQYTGLLDRKTRKIYEGDILRCCGDSDIPPMAIEYDAPLWVLKARNDNYDALLGSFGSWGIEVIGNIHENPELLDEQEVQA